MGKGHRVSTLTSFGFGGPLPGWHRSEASLIITVSQENGLAVSPALAQVRDLEKLQKTSRVAKHTEDHSGMAQLLLKMYCINICIIYLYRIIFVYLDGSARNGKTCYQVLWCSLLMILDVSFRFIWIGSCLWHLCARSNTTITTTPAAPAPASTAPATTTTTTTTTAAAAATNTTNTTNTTNSTNSPSTTGYIPNVFTMASTIGFRMQCCCLIAVHLINYI